MIPQPDLFLQFEVDSIANHSDRALDTPETHTQVSNIHPSLMIHDWREDISVTDLPPPPTFPPPLNTSACCETLCNLWILHLILTINSLRIYFHIVPWFFIFFLLFLIKKSRLYVNILWLLGVAYLFQKNFLEIPYCNYSFICTSTLNLLVKYSIITSTLLCSYTHFQWHTEKTIQFSKMLNLQQY